MISNFVLLVMVAMQIVISFVYFAYRRKVSGSMSQAISETFIVLLIPLFGVLFFLVINATRYFRKKGEETADIYHQYNNEFLILGEQMQYESDILPLNDVLDMGNAEQKFTLLTEAIKQNVLSNHTILKKAIRDEDREISHYAASFVTTAIEEVEARLFQLEQQLQQTPDEVELLKEYVNTMQDYLGIGFLDINSRRKVEKSYINFLDKLVSLYPDDPTYYVSKIDYDIDNQNFTSAEASCLNFLQQFPLSEEPYLMYLKLYKKTNEYKKFQEKIRELKKCPIQLTAKALNTIRFWDQEGSYV